MNEWVENTDASATTVSVWTPWGEQKVMRADKRALLRRVAARMRRTEDAVAPQSLSESAFGGSRA